MSPSLREGYAGASRVAVVKCLKSNLVRFPAASMYAFLQASPTDRLNMLYRLAEQLGEPSEPAKNGVRVKVAYLLPAKLQAVFDEQVRLCGYLRQQVMATVVCHFLESSPDDRARMAENLERFLSE